MNSEDEHELEENQYFCVKCNTGTWVDKKENCYMCGKSCGEQTPDFKKAYNILMDAWHEFCDETQVELNKRLEKLGL